MAHPDEKPAKQSENPAHAWARYSQIAFILPSAVVVGLLLGALVDRWLHSTWGIIAGVILGAVAGFVQLIRVFSRLSNKE